jgi:hypothetical protein
MRYFKVLALLIACLSFCQNAHALLLEFDVVGRRSPFTSGYGAVGDEGLYLGQKPGDPGVGAYPHVDPFKNFRFEAMILQIDSETGDAVMKGTMKNLGSLELWYLNMELTEFEFHAIRPLVFSQDTPYDEMVEDLIGLRPDGVGYYGNGSGFLWGSLSFTMTPLLEDPVYDGPRNWAGMDETHPLSIFNGFSAGLGFASTYLFFDAWYMPEIPTALYTFGDSKAFATNYRQTQGPPGGQDNPAVPEPATLALFSAGLMGAALARFRRA